VVLAVTGRLLLLLLLQLLLLLCWQFRA